MKRILRCLLIGLLALSTVGFPLLSMFVDAMHHPAPEDIDVCTATIASVSIHETSSQTFINICTQSPAYLLHVPGVVISETGRGPFDTLREGQTITFMIDHRRDTASEEGDERFSELLALETEAGPLFTLDDYIRCSENAWEPVLLAARIVSIICGCLLAALIAVPRLRKRPSP